MVPRYQAQEKLVKLRGLHARIPEELHRRLKLHAVEMRSSVQEEVVKALQKHLKRRVA